VYFDWRLLIPHTAVCKRTQIYDVTLLQHCTLNMYTVSDGDDEDDDDDELMIVVVVILPYKCGKKVCP